MREKLIELIQSAVSGCARYWAELIADRLIATGVIPEKCKGCYYYDPSNPGRGFCKYFEILRVDNDFCSSWERKGNG